MRLEAGGSRLGLGSRLEVRGLRLEAGGLFFIGGDVLSLLPVLLKQSLKAICEQSLNEICEQRTGAGRLGEGVGGDYSGWDTKQPAATFDS